MEFPQTPTNEVQRLKALHNLQILDTPPEERFDRITRLTRAMMGTDMALVSLIDLDRQWFKSRQGLDASETPRDISFCGHAINGEEIFEVSDAVNDPRFADNPLVTGAPYIRFYAGAPLRTSEGLSIGTLCIIDRKPRQLTDDEKLSLQDFARCIETEINRHEEISLRKQISTDQIRLSGILEGTRIGTWEWNVQTGQTVFNSRWAEIIGYSLAELEPVNIDTWTQFAHPGDVEMSGKLLAQHFAGKLPFYDCECRMRHKDGHWVWVHDRGRVMTWTVDGKPLTMYGTHADISESKEAQRQLQRHNRALGLLNHIAFDLTGNLDEQIEEALRLGCEFLEMDSGIVVKVVGQNCILDWLSTPKDSRFQRGQTFAIAETYADLALHTNTEVAIEHMAESPYRDHRCYATFAQETYLGLSLQLAGNQYGAVNFAAKAPRLRPFDDTDRLFLGLFNRWVGAQLEERGAQDRLDRLVEQVPGTIYQFLLRADGSIALPYASPGLKRIYGLDPKDVRDDASPIYTKICPQDLPAYREAAARSVKTLENWYCQYRVVQADGSLTWIEGRSRPQRLPDGGTLWHGYITDIDERKQAELALQESEKMFRSLFELSPIGIVLNEVDTGVFVDCNDAFLAPTGYTHDEFIKLKYWDLTPSEYEPQEILAIAQMREKGHYDAFEKELVRKDGSRFPVNAQGIRVKSSDGRHLIWSLVEDVSERKKMEKMKSEFVSTVSHELRTPLTSISGALGLLRSGVLGQLQPKVQEIVQIALKNSQRLTVLINDLLDMDKLVSGKMQFDLRPHSLRSLLEQVLQSNQAYADQYQVELLLDSVGDDITITVDSQRFEQIMANLLSNAIKFSPAGGQVDILVSQVNNEIEIAVADQGPGISTEFRSRIFQKFAQADASDTRAKGGTGLGLAITKELVERMGGKMGFHSIPGNGARFYLRLPSSETSSA